MYRVNRERYCHCLPPSRIHTGMQPHIDSVSEVSGETAQGPFYAEHR